MRAIKVRVWAGGTMYYPDSFQVDSEGVSFQIPTGGTFKGPDWMQYTGLKDKNGKEVFEGDVVLLDGDTPMGPMGDWHDVVEWNTDKAMFWLRHGETPLYDEMVLEVRGNIHQNADLLD